MCIRDSGGRVFDLEPVAGGEKVSSLISLDKLTNRFVAMALKDIYIPQTLKNAPLSPEQQQEMCIRDRLWVPEYITVIEPVVGHK